jgi:hypothetical protein
LRSSSSWDVVTLPERDAIALDERHRADGEPVAPVPIPIASCAPRSSALHHTHAVLAHQNATIQADGTRGITTITPWGRSLLHGRVV